MLVEGGGGIVEFAAPPKYRYPALLGSTVIEFAKVCICPSVCELLGMLLVMSDQVPPLLPDIAGPPSPIPYASEVSCWSKITLQPSPPYVLVHSGAPVHWLIPLS